MADVKKLKNNDVVIDKQNDIDPDIFSSDLDYYINLFCQENNIQDLKLESNNFFNAVMMYLYKHCIKDKYNLKINKSHNPNNTNFKTHSYNTDLLNKILNIYIILCLKYNKDINIYSFCLLTNIDYSTICIWGNMEATTPQFEIYKKLSDGRQQCLTNKLSDGKQNPVGVIAILNHFYNWQTTAAAQGNTNKTALTSENLPQLADNKQIID